MPKYHSVYTSISATIFSMDIIAFKIRKIITLKHLLYNNKSKGNESKNKQVGLHQTKKLLHSKGNQRNEKGTFRIGENICKTHLVKD